MQNEIPSHLLAFDTTVLKSLPNNVLYNVLLIQLEKNEADNKKETQVENHSVTKNHYVVKQIFQDFETLAKIVEENDFGKYMETLLKIRLRLEMKEKIFNEITGNPKDAAVGNVIRKILQNLTGAALDYVSLLHKENQSKSLSNIHKPLEIK
jgi:hypothetical protein